MTMKVLIDDISKIKRFTSIALSLPFDVDVVSGRYVCDAKSIMGILSLDVAKPVGLRFDMENEDRVRFAFSEFEVRT